MIADRLARPVVDRRGQTTLDFVIAIGVFLLAVAFTFSFTSGLIGPFTQDQAESAVADRVADAVVDDLSDDVSQPNRLNETCTEAYFTRDGGAECPFDVSTSLAEQAGVGDAYHVAVTLATPDGGRTLRTGDAVPGSSTTVATARRTVLVDDRLAVLEVRVWS